MVKLYLPQIPFQGADGPVMAKIPMVNPAGTVANWQDPDPLMWFDLENLPNFAQIDLYCVLGSNNVQIPLDFNGLGFSIKLGILTNENVHNDFLGGGAHNNRIQNRTWNV